MNVYDFDKTIYDGDSTIDFYLYCLRKRPKILCCAFRQCRGILLHKMHKIDTTAMKEQFFSFLLKLDVDDTNALVNTFWKKKQKKIKRWYLQRKDASDVIISASPAFLLRPICEKLAITEPIATQMDISTGRIQGSNCKGEEKIRRFYAQYPNETIQHFYSDSKTDTPLASLAKTAFFVQGNNLLPWK
ncbi:MAG: HAD-IB family phosphatase [Clostridiales bacterium]|jgi:phosphatidylglycerophosphatase C|nr:HAD-IB family phosphatase [Clostridiales bacterium]